MSHRTSISTFLIAAIMMICTSIGCKKAVEQTDLLQPADISTAAIAKTWMSEKKQNESKAVQQGIDSLLYYADWQQGVQTNSSDNKTIIYIPIRNSIIGLEFFYDSRAKKIDSGNIVKVLNRKTDIPNSQILGIQAYYESVILHHQAPEFTGTISAYSITNKFLYDYIYNKGKIAARGLAAPKLNQQNINPKTDGVKNTDNGSCELWGHYTIWESGAITLDYTWLVCSPGDCLPISLAVSVGGRLYVKTNCESGPTPNGGYIGGGSTGGIENVVVYSGPDKITNILQYMECFTSGGTNCKVKLFVNQPNPGTADVFSLTDVGHSYLSFTQTLPNGTVVSRNVGFYPSGLVTPFNTMSAGELDNDQSSPYNVGLEISVSSSDFMTMVGNVQTNLTHLPYDLNNFNCVGWSMAILKSGGIDLQTNTEMKPGYFLGSRVFFGYCPGALGQTVNNMTLSSNMSRFSSGSHPNTGTCQ